MSNRRNRISKDDNMVSFTKADGTIGRELGVPGLQVSMGQIKEDTIALLRGPKKIKLLEEMADYDPMVGAFNNMLKSQAESVEWKLEDAEDSNEAKKVTEFINSILFQDLSTGSFDDLVSNALTKIVYGFSLIEPVYKKRDGFKKDKKKSSKFTDGKIGISKFASRYQGSISKFNFDDKEREVVSVVQKDPNSFEEITIDYGKLLHFKHNSTNGNPQGKSLYLNCVVPYNRKKNTEKSQDQRYDKGFSGIYEITLPSAILDPNTSNTAFKDTVKWAKDTGTNISAGRSQAVIKPEYVKTDIKSSSKDTEDANLIIADCDRKIAVALLSDFFLVTQKSGNSGALGQSKIKVFKTLVNSILDEIENELNENLIYNLMIKNSLDLNLAPKLKHSDVEDLDLTNLMLFLQSADKSKLLAPTLEASNYITKKVLGKDFPETDQETFNKYLMRQEVITNNSMDKPDDQTFTELKEEIID